MEFQVNTNNVILSKINQVESGEYNVTECRFNFSSEYDGLTKIAVFTGANGDAYKITILNNKCEIPSELLTESQIVQIGVYAYEVQDTEFVLRYSPMPTRFMIEKGSYVVNAVNMSRPTPSEIEQLQSQITQNSNDIEGIQGDIAGINQELVGINGELLGINRDIDDIKAEQTEQNTNIQKNTDDIVNINQAIDTINTDITDIDSAIGDINEDIDNLEQDLTNYSLITETGSQINLNVNSTNYQITAILKDKNGNVIYTSNAIDLPIESMIINASYDNTTKEIVLTLQNGNTLRVSVADLISGLVSETKLQTILANYYTKTEVNNLLSNLAERVSTNEEDIADIKEEQTTQNANIEELQSQVETLQEDLESANSEIAELNTDITNMRKAMITVERQGTDITLENTSENKFVEFGLEGRTEQEQLTGKNLLPFPYNSAHQSINKDGQIVLNGNYAGNFSLILTNTLLLPAGTYILSFGDNNNDLPNGTYALLRDVENDVFIDNYIKKYNKTFTLENSTKIGVTIVIIRGTYNNEILEPMIRLSSITDGTWEKYCGGIPSPNPEYPQQIKNVTGNANVKIQNKNLFDIGTQKSDYSKQEVINEFIENGIKFNVIDYGNTVTYRLQNLEGNKQYVLTALSSVAKGRFYIRIRSQDDSRWLNNNDINLQAYGWSYVSSYNGWYLTFNSTTMSKVITLPECLYWQLGLGFESASSIVGTIQIISNIQVEQGSTATSYVEHQEQNYPFTFSEGQRGMQGTTLEDNGIHNTRTQLVIDGTENITLSTATVGTSNYGKFDVTISKRANVNDRTALCSHLKYKFQGWTTAGNENTFSFTTATTLRLLLDINEFSTVEALKTYLANNNMTFEFVTEQPERIQYNETQQAQYNAIKEASSYDDITYISSESDELGFDMNVVAVANANKVINTQNNEIDTIKSRLDLLEG